MVPDAVTQAHAVTLENFAMRLAVRPDLGGRIDQIEDCKTGHSWLWHPANYEPEATRSLSLDASFDAAWAGGWDEMFPNDAAGSFQGRNLVDHGELWSQRWEVLECSPLKIRLGYQCQTVPVRVEKTIRLEPNAPQARLVYEFENQSGEQIPFLLKLHAAIAIEAGDEILLPDCWVEPAFPEFSTVIGQPGKTRFPWAIAPNGETVDLRVVPPVSSKLREFYYSSDLARGYCGIRNQRTQSALLMAFDTADFPYVWMFQSFGGWCDRYVVVVEPCTTMPSDLEEACRQQTVSILHPHETQRRVLTFELQAHATVSG